MPLGHLTRWPFLHRHNVQCLADIFCCRLRNDYSPDICVNDDQALSSDSSTWWKLTVRADGIFYELLNTLLVGACCRDDVTCFGVSCMDIGGRRYYQGAPG